MDVIYAEKPDVGTKIAAALSGITLDDGTIVTFDAIGRYEGKIKKQRHKDGYFRIIFHGKQTIVTWGFGHMCELKQAQDINPEYRNWKNLPLPFIPEKYDLKVIEGAEGQFAKVKQLLCKADRIICATDNDREGDLIFDYVYQMSGSSRPFKRAIFDSQTKEEFQKAFWEDRLVDGKDRIPVIQAGQARSAGDFLVGSGPTAAMSLKYPGNGVLSVGRVQTAVLDLIVTREKEIINFKPEDYYVIRALFTRDTGEQYMGTHETKRFKQKAEAEKVLNKLLNSGRSATVVDRKDEKSKKKKPFLYNLSSLQVDANKKYGFTLDHTLKLAQSLYEKGFTTYPRTDSMYLTEDMVPDVKKVLENLFAATGYSDLRVPISLSAKDRHYFNDSRVESHYAIIPTAKTVRGLTEDEAKLYDLIARSVICMVYPDAALGKTVVRTESGSETFTTSGNSVIEPGFYKVIGLPKQTLVPDVVKGETMQGTKYRMEPKKTEPPKRYTDATLLNAMKTCGKTIDDEELRALMAGKPGEQPKGLGRPSSQASIVDTLTKREYIERKGKTIYPIKKGIGMIDCFPVKDLKSALMTAQWEKRLDDIETGKDTYDSFMSDLEDQVRVWTRQILDAPVKDALNPAGDRKCPACGGDVRAFNWGYKCQACGLTVGKTVAGKKIPDRQMDKLFGKGETDVIDGFQSKDGKKFSARLKVDKENRKVIFDFSSPETTMKCPKCGKPVIHGPIGFFCSGYRETGCRFGLSKIGGKKVTEAQAEKLLSGKTISMSGLKSKKGTTYSAKVSMVLSGDECGQLKFEFPKSRQGGKK